MILGYQRYIGDAEFTETKFLPLMLLFGLIRWREETWRLGYLTSNEARAACKYLAKIERAQKSKVGSSGYRQSEDRQTERGIIAVLTGGAAILSIVMLLIFFQGKSTDAWGPQDVADSSVQANPNKLNPPPDDIVAAQNRLIELRFLAGPSDGVWGPKSRMALRAFKIANGLTADDKWDDLVSARLHSNQAARSPLPLARTGR
jgi:hypothetical protein